MSLAQDKLDGHVSCFPLILAYLILLFILFQMHRMPTIRQSGEKIKCIPNITFYTVSAASPPQIQRNGKQIKCISNITFVLFQMHRMPI